ncbi:MAG: twin-arginine translocation pathway signal protein [Gammaproteobacteria bacterium]|nr:twin-arginine translocation pathway signal protein [Gammaproteobacteria bacterium]
MKSPIDKKVSRRALIKSSATATGGLLLAFHLPSFSKARPFESYLESAEEINAWLTIGIDDTITIRVAQAEMGQGVFTSLPMIVAEELEADWRKVRAEYADVNRSIRQDRIYRMMDTGGSRAVRRSREYLQQAGAEARERLIKAAAEQWLVSPDECYADYGRIYHKGSGRSTNYGAVAADAAKVSVVGVRIKTPEEFELLGLPTPRLDVPAKVNGTATFGMDIRIPGMVYAAVAHCPVLGGEVRSLRFNTVRNQAGVLKSVRMKHSVAIVAEHYWQAKTAVEAMPVQWVLGPAGKTYSEIFKREFVAELENEGTVLKESGNVAAAMDEAEKSFESDYVVPYLAHACMEPLNCTVHIQEDRVDVWLGTQFPESALAVTAEITGQSPENVYIHNCFLGCGFGRRSSTDYVEEAVHIAKEVGKPVQMIWSREEDMRSGYYRPMAAMRFKAGFDLDKNLIAYSNRSVTHSIRADHGGSSKKVDSSSVSGLVDMPYEVEHKKISHTAKNTHLTSWWWRSVGHSQNAYAMECFVDEMATSSRMDPFAFRRKHLADRPDLLDVLEVLEKKSNWGKKRLPRGTAQGIAIHESFGTICGQVAEVTVSGTGELKIDRIVSVLDCGNLVNPLTAEMQVESAIMFGLTAALYGKLTVENGVVLEDNLDTYRIAAMAEAPVIETHFALSGGDKWAGLGEPATPPVAPAVCNALYKITGRRIRILPIKDYMLRRA